MKLALKIYAALVVFQWIYPAIGWAQFSDLDLGCYVFTESHTCDEQILIEEPCAASCTNFGQVCTNPSYYYKFGEDYETQWIAVRKSDYLEGGYLYDGNGFEIFCERFGYCECNLKPGDLTLTQGYCSERGNFDISTGVFPLDINGPCVDDGGPDWVPPEEP